MLCGRIASRQCCRRVRGAVTDLPPGVSARHHSVAAAPLVSDDVITPRRRAEFVSRVSAQQLALPGSEAEPGAAVLALLCRVRGTPGLLYTLRSAALNKHAGEVAFPGGVRDAQDEDLIATAIRETHEEIGLRVARDQVWTRLTAMLSRHKQRPVASFVADVGEIDLNALRPEPREVADIFVLSLDHLCRPENLRQTQFRMKDAKGYAMPVFVNGPHRVWGFTAIKTYVLLLNLLPELFKHKVKFIKPVPLEV